MQKKYLIILVVLVIVGGFQLYFYFSDSVPASRQQIELSTSEFAAEGEFALDAVKSYYHDSRKFSRCWNNYGDIFQNAVKLLKERKLREPEIRRIYRFKSSSNRITVELGDGHGPDIAVMVWRGSDGRLAISDISELE